MTPEQAKQYAATIQKLSEPGPKGEAPHLTKEQALAQAAALGATLAASDPDTGVVDPALAARLRDASAASSLSLLLAPLNADPSTAALTAHLLSFDLASALGAALKSGAQFVTASKGGAVDAKLQAALDAAASAADAASAGAQGLAHSAAVAQGKG